MYVCIYIYIYIYTYTARAPRGLTASFVTTTLLQPFEFVCTLRLRAQIKTHQRGGAVETGCSDVYDVI